MTASTNAAVPLSTAQKSHMSFSGDGDDFLKILITGSLFQIPSFGFYRFWLITKLRRHLWANTQIGGEAFEYTGTAKELLIGFLIALAVLVPLYITYFILGLMLEEQRAFASIPLILVMYVLMHFGSYRARKYRGSRTIFRGVRFWMKGSGWAYALRAVLWDFATLLSLGLALPWAMASLERYRMRQTYFGNIQGYFAGTGWSLFKRAWWIWALGLALIGGLLFALGASTGAATDDNKTGLGFFTFLLILVPLGLWPLAMAIFTRWHIDGLRFGDVIVSSGLRAGVIYGLFFKLFFSSIAFMVAFAIVVGVSNGFITLFFEEAYKALRAGEMTWGASILGALIATAYLTFVLGFGVIKRYFFGRGLWMAIVTTSTVSNLHSADAALAAGQPAGMLGEGLADALDFNVGI